MRALLLCLAGVFPFVIYACVGDDAVSTSPGGDGGSDSPTTGSEGGVDSSVSDGEADAADAADASCKGTAAGCPEDVISVSAGFFVACAVRREGTVYCWGSNQSATLGVFPGPNDSLTNNTHYRSTPTKIPVLTAAVEVSVGAEYACARKSDGTVWCWGSNQDGRLGHASSADVNCTAAVGGAMYPCNAEPKQVAGFPVGVKVTSLSAGNNVACAIGDDKNVYCWGSNDEGRAGKDPIGGTLDAATKITTTALDGHAVGISTCVGAGLACARSDDKTVWCWGANDRGRVGLPSPAVSTGIPNHVIGPGAVPLANVSAIVVGTGAPCAQTPSGIFCWGSNQWGQHAVGDWDSAFNDVARAASTVPSGAVLIEDSRYSGYFARGSNVVAWGLSTWGALGNGSTGGGGTTTAQPCGPVSYKANCIGTAQTVSALKDMVGISGGTYFGVGRKADGTAWAWGRNDFGQIGHDPNGAGAGDSACTATGEAAPCNPVPSQVKGLDK